MLAACEGALETVVKEHDMSLELLRQTGTLKLFDLPIDWLADSLPLAPATSTEGARQQEDQSSHDETSSDESSREASSTDEVVRPATQGMDIENNIVQSRPSPGATRPVRSTTPGTARSGGAKPRDTPTAVRAPIMHGHDTRKRRASGAGPGP